MTIRALFFARYREIAGTDALDVELPAGASASELVHHLRATGGAWESLPAAPAIAVNQSYAPLSTPLAHGDEVAFIPPVSGG
jgi:molybdopterin converting factor subunit 1